MHVRWVSRHPFRSSHRGGYTNNRASPMLRRGLYH